jgi:hypothetical protein
VTGQSVSAIRSEDLGDVMRSTRTGEYDIYIAPAHVAASALGHGYALIGSTERDETYQLVAKPGVTTPGELKNTRIYLTQQDSVGAYMARGMLNESGQSLKIFQQVMYRRTSGARVGRSAAARQEPAGYSPLQRRGMLEVVQGGARRTDQRLQVGLLVPRRLPGMG